jgi:hypothetical protein
MSVTIAADSHSSSTLKKLQLFIKQQEEIQGILIGLGNDGVHTVIEIDNDQNPPANPAILKQTIGDIAISIPGHNFICKGNCFIAGQKLQIAAYRSNNS